MMRVAIILYVLAAMLLSAVVTHYFTREAFIQRTEKVTERLMRDQEIAGTPDGLSGINKIGRMYRISANGPCLLALYLFAPFLSCLYGAVTINRGIVRGKPRSRLWIAVGMGVVFVLGLLLAALAVPC
jgi:hypothetical protein